MCLEFYFMLASQFGSCDWEKRKRRERQAREIERNIQKKIERQSVQNLDITFSFVIDLDRFTNVRDKIVDMLTSLNDNDHHLRFSNFHCQQQRWAHFIHSIFGYVKAHHPRKAIESNSSIDMSALNEYHKTEKSRSNIT